MGLATNAEFEEGLDILAENTIKENTDDGISPKKDVQYKVPPLTEDKARKLVTALRKVIADALKEKELDPLSDNELFDRCTETLTRSYDRIVRAPLLEELNDL